MVSLPFPFRSRVRIDDSDVIGMVQGYTMREEGFIQVEVAWLNNGQNYEGWFHWKRLKLVDKPESQR